ncbi:MAG: hypothetical protein WKF70_09655 [Chitinophagaceae bacterium]
MQGNPRRLVEMPQPKRLAQQKHILFVISAKALQQLQMEATIAL